MAICPDCGEYMPDADYHDHMGKNHRPEAYLRAGLAPPGYEIEPALVPALLAYRNVMGWHGDHDVRGVRAVAQALGFPVSGPI